MSAPADPAKIDTTVEADGSVMMNAADIVAWLHHCAQQYGSGAYGPDGGSRTIGRRNAAREALDAVANSIQSAYIDVAADEATRWFGGLA